MSEVNQLNIGSDLNRLDGMLDEDIDYEDAPIPNLAEWVRDARPFKKELENRQ